VRYAFIAAHASRGGVGGWPVEDLCVALAVSRSGYYAWRRRPESARRARDHELSALVHVVHAMSRRSYGSPRIHRELVATGTPCGRHRVARLMREEGLRAKQGRRFRPRSSAPPAALAPNRLARRFHRARSATELDRAWAADATVIPTREGWLHLITVVDLGSRHVVGWAAGPDLNEALACRALRSALGTRRPAPGLLVHSDQGSPFVSRGFHALLDQAGAMASMSRRGNCWDNAVVESFFHTLKDERRELLPYRSFTAARADLFEFIEVWYNRRRRHSTLNHLSPIEYEAQLQELVSP
jgi:putative transposase